MKILVILGHGSGGTIIATQMRQKLAEKDWGITVIDRDWQHHYQPGWLLIAFVHLWRAGPRRRRCQGAAPTAPTP